MNITPFRINKIRKYKKKIEKINILDIGCGSNSPSITKKYFPNCQYTGVDRQDNYRNSNKDNLAYDRFIQKDVSDLQFDCLENNSFDILIMSHIIEHLFNGDKVIEGLISKLKHGGIIYIEFPSERSVEFPSMHDTLNYFDDNTHCRIFSKTEICNLLMLNKLKILEVSTRREYINILLIPIKVFYYLVLNKKIPGGVFWDLYGFADYVIAKKK